MYLLIYCSLEEVLQRRTESPVLKLDRILGKNSKTLGWG